MTPAEPAVHTDGAVSCGTFFWRYDGRLQLTVVVKAVFTIMPDAVAASAGPGEIVVEDRHFDDSPFRSVAAASDLAPYLDRCDVLFTGHACAPDDPAVAPGTRERPAATSAMAVRIGVSRNGEWLLDKTLHVYGDRGPTGKPEPFSRMPLVYERGGGDAPNVVDPRGTAGPAGLGPISHLWSARRRLLAGVDAGQIDRLLPDVPSGMSSDYFQAAPPDQQIDLLHGGEWLVLEGLLPGRPSAGTRLPSSRAAARVAVCRPGAPPEESAVDLACDTLAIDGDQRTFSLSWRGGLEVPEDGAGAPAMIVLAAMPSASAEVDWDAIRQRPPQEPAGGRRVLWAQRARAETLDLCQFGGDPPEAALPFKPSDKTPSRPPSADGTPFGFGLGMRLESAPLGGMRVPCSLVAGPPPPMDDEATFVSDRPSEPEAEPPVWIQSPPPEPLLEEMRPPPRYALPPEPLLEEAPPAPRYEPSPAPEPPPAPRYEPPPPRAKPPADPWARPFDPPPAEPPPAPPKRTFARPATAAVKGSFYSKFGGK